MSRFTAIVPSRKQEGDAGKRRPVHGEGVVQELGEVQGRGDGAVQVAVMPSGDGEIDPCDQFPC